MPFPEERPRRLRRTEALRRLVREVQVRPEQLVQPLFVRAGTGNPEPIASMPGQVQHTVESIVSAAEAGLHAGIGGVMLFGIPAAKDSDGTGALDEDGPVPAALRRLRRDCPDLLLLSDVCLCEYTSHGHCGVLRGETVDNDATLDLLGGMAALHAACGADVVAPSDMMDGRVGHIRAALDEAGHAETAILAYAAKHASAFYGPFRDAADSAPQFGDRRGYQMDPANRREAMREIRLDLAEGADLVMVKPALPCLDLISDASAISDRPVAAYHVSGEYAMLKAAAERGWLDERRCALEMLTAIVRAGADIVLTYWATEAAGWLREESAAGA